MPVDELRKYSNANMAKNGLVNKYDSK
jgi:hypothetical protein